MHTTKQRTGEGLRRHFVLVCILQRLILALGDFSGSTRESNRTENYEVILQLVVWYGSLLH